MTGAFAAPSPRLTGPQKALQKLGLRRPIDFALHLPLRYEDETRLVQLRDVRDGDIVQVQGVVTHSEVKLARQRQLLVTLDDGSGQCLLRFFTFYPSMQKTLAVGQKLRVRGQIHSGFMGLGMMHPSYQAAGAELPRTLTPVYPSVAGLTQAYLRKAVQTGLAKADLDTIVPASYFASIGLAQTLDLRQALLFLHQPSAGTSLSTLQDQSHAAWQRVKAEELLAQQLAQLQAKALRAQRSAAALLARAPSQVSGQGECLAERLLASLPFQLTAAQCRVVAEIDHDLQRSVPMNRLLQGDVGSGKTVVAALAATRCIDAGWQCALMAPTEILATQHFVKLVSWLQPLGVTVAWLLGRQPAKQRRTMQALIAGGQAQLVVGTHAMLQERVQFNKLALVIIDEQHRFGVAQRLALRAKSMPNGQVAALTEQAGQAPDATVEAALEAPEAHLLMMSATPIPRTLAMSYYADLEVSTIDELPPGRTPVLTRLLHASRRGEVIERIRGQLRGGRQIYWVCPLIEESAALDLRNATQTYAELCAALPAVQVGLLHARLPTAQKLALMAQFSSGEMQLLVSTTVIEVGVDVANASLMVIEHAERFGLSQLHQLRGRVGRGAAASACVLLYASGQASRLGALARARLKTMLECNDGFAIAKRDLELRGPGEFMGARQSGAALLRFADLAHDDALLKWACQTAPQLLARQPELAARQVQRWLATRSEFLKV